ncbi:probable proline--tRNA ligase, mitochondrial [Tetranychus urticae]|uniref:proline--tRNA ligase n=1 Tax=Tetranychus urticae TaxID=32264 RepID=T1KFQ3_TETUR|nr:probable proline--tRNA ligase, mitochondrial [Tetranychus urticae]
MKLKSFFKWSCSQKRFLHLPTALTSSEPHRMTRVLLLTEKPHDATASKSLTLMINNSLISTITSGLHYVLPLATRSLAKLTAIIDQEMETIGCQKVILPTLGHLDLLQVSGKWSEHKEDIFTLNDRHKQALFMAPTHEEMFCSWLSREKLVEKQLPLYLYQVTSKFRDEARPRGGLLRGREFVMKDLYSFDATESDAHKSYDLVCQSYQNIFDRLKLNVIKTKADPGTIGGKHSHEYHLISDAGEDTIYICSQCNHSFSEEYMEKNAARSNHCANCKCDLQAKQSLEVGHAFYLSTRYTEPFKCFYRSRLNTYCLLEMGSYGLGVTRILASCVEILSTNRVIGWPALIAPYQICIIPPKTGSKEDNLGVTHLAEDLARHLNKYTKADVVIDDRTELTIGHRVVDAKCLGIPIIIIAGRKCLESIPLFEFSYLNGSERNMKDLSFLDIMKEVESFVTNC